MKTVCEFAGGEFNGLVVSKSSVIDDKDFDIIGYTEDLTAIRNNGGMVRRAELDNQPIIKGYLSPMFNGIYDNTLHLRYETKEVYDSYYFC